MATVGIKRDLSSYLRKSSRENTKRKFDFKKSWVSKSIYSCSNELIPEISSLDNSISAQSSHFTLPTEPIAPHEATISKEQSSENNLKNTSGEITSTLNEQSNIVVENDELKDIKEEEEQKEQEERYLMNSELSMNIEELSKDKQNMESILSENTILDDCWNEMIMHSRMEISEEDIIIPSENPCDIESLEDKLSKCARKKSKINPKNITSITIVDDTLHTDNKRVFNLRKRLSGKNGEQQREVVSSPLINNANNDKCQQEIKDYIQNYNSEETTTGACEVHGDFRDLHTFGGVRIHHLIYFKDVLDALQVQIEAKVRESFQRRLLRAYQTTTTTTSAPTATTVDPTAPDTSTSEPTAPTADPTAPDTSTSEPTAPTAPTADPTAPTAESTAPTADPTTPTADPTAPTADPSAPTAEPTASTADPTAPTSGVSRRQSIRRNCRKSLF